MVGGMVVYLEGQAARRLLNVAGVDMYIVNASAGKLDEVAAKLKTICEPRQPPVEQLRRGPPAR